MRRFWFLPVLCLALAVPAAGSAGGKKDPPEKEDPAKSLPRLIELLKKSEDPATRADAAMALAEFGPLAKEAVPDLMEMLTSGDEDQRLNAAITLGKIGKAAVGPVIEALKAKDNDVRFYALWALGWIGAEGKDAGPLVLKLLGDKDAGVRRKAAFALGRVGASPEEAVPALIKTFDDKDHDVQRAAGEAVAKYGKKAVPLLIAALNNKKTRRQAAVSLGEIGSEAKEAIPALKKALLESEKDKEDPTPVSPPDFDGGVVFPGGPGFPGGGRPFPGRRPFPGPFPGGEDHPSTGNVYTDALSKIGKAAIPALEEALKEGNERTRNAVLQAYAKIGADAVPNLVDALGDKRVDVRRSAAMALGPMRVGDKMVVVGLAYALKKDEDDLVRQHVLSALQQLGAAAKEAAPALQEALADININVRQGAFYTLQGMGIDNRPGLKKALDHKDAKIRVNIAALMMTTGIDPELALPVLTAGLKEKDPSLRMQAAHALAITNRERDKVVPVLIEGLKIDSVPIRLQALQALQNMGPAGAAAALPILELFEDKDPQVRQQALYTIQNIRPDAKLVLPHLTKMLKHEDPTVRQQSIGALQNLGGDLKAVKDDLMPLIKDKDVNVRTSVLPLFGRMGEAGIPILIEGLEDKEPQVRWTSAQALQSMGAAGKKAIPHLLAGIKDENVNVRHNCIFALTNMGNEGADALVKSIPDFKDVDARMVAMQQLIYGPHRAKVVPMVLEGLKSKDATMKLSCVQMVQNIGRLKEAWTLLVELVEDKDANVRQSAAFAVVNQGPEGWPALEKIFSKTPDAGVKLAIVQTFQNYGFQPKDSIGKLIDCLKEKNPQLRWMTCHVLGNMGAAAKEAAPLLQDLLKDPDTNVQTHARLALNRMGVEPMKTPSKKKTKK